MKDKINTDKIAINLFSESISPKTQICPYLGLKDDPSTALGFPSLGNYCYHAKPVNPVKLEAQRIYCLSINHPNCGQFNQSPDTHLSSGLRSSVSSRRLKIFRKNNLWILLLVLAATGLITWQVYSRGLLGLKNPGFPPANAAPVEVPVMPTLRLR